jgi:hypothetical protein
MNATVGDIDRRPVKPALVLGFAPQGGRSNFKISFMVAPDPTMH